MEAMTSVKQDKTGEPAGLRLLRPASLLRAEGVALLALSVMLYLGKRGKLVAFRGTAARARPLYARLPCRS
jgi:hypothetical protein